MIVLVLILHFRTLYYEFKNKLKPEPNLPPVDSDHPNQQG
jgi:putative tricarboxylic transport membrane protein